MSFKFDKSTSILNFVLSAVSVFIIAAFWAVVSTVPAP